MSTKYVRHGFGAVRPYLYGNLELLEFVSDGLVRSRWSVIRWAIAISEQLFLRIVLNNGRFRHCNQQSEVAVSDNEWHLSWGRYL